MPKVPWQHLPGEDSEPTRLELNSESVATSQVLPEVSLCFQFSFPEPFSDSLSDSKHINPQFPDDYKSRSRIIIKFLS